MTPHKIYKMSTWFLEDFTAMDRNHGINVWNLMASSLVHHRFIRTLRSRS